MPVLKAFISGGEGSLWCILSRRKPSCFSAPCPLEWTLPPTTHPSRIPVIVMFCSLAWGPSADCETKQTFSFRNCSDRDLGHGHIKFTLLIEVENLGGRFFDSLWCFYIGNIRKERNIGKSGKLLSPWRIKIYFMGGLIWSRPQPRQTVGLFSRLQHLHPGLQPRHLPLAVQFLWRGHLLFCTTGDCAESTDPACPGLLRLIQTHSCRPHQNDFASREAEADPKLALSIFLLF